MKNTIFKKVKSIHSKSNSKYYKNNGESNNHKLKLKKNSSNKDNIIHSETNNNTDINNINNINNVNNINNNLENHTNFLTITIEKESINNESNNYNSEFKMKPINNNLNLSNKYQIKSKYIFIEKEKNLSPNLNHMHNDINYAPKKLPMKKLKGNFISIKKNKNLCKNIKEKVNGNINSHNSNKVLNKILIEPENQTIKNNDEMNINLNNESLNYEKKDPIPNTTSNTKNKYKHYNLKLKAREKSLNKKNKLIIEEEKTIVNDINYINKNIMNYFHKLSGTAENNNKKKDSKIIIKEIINERNETDKNNNININPDTKNMKSNLSKNLLNSEKKSNKENIDIFQNNKLMKQRELNKKINKQKMAGNIKINITENREKKINQNQNSTNNKISNKKIIKKNIIKKRSNNNHEKEDLNQNISNSSINQNLFMKIDENPPNNIYKKKKKIKENINNSYFAIMKKKELKEMKSENISLNNKLNNILLKTNTSEEKLNIIPKYININLNLNKNNYNNYNQTQINSNNKKNLAFFSQNSQSKIVNNSTNNIHKHNLVNKDMIKIKINNHNHNKENSINKYSNKNQSIKINLNDFKKHKMKRSISPNMNSNINLRHTANNKNFRIKKIESNFFMNEVIIDLSKYIGTNSNNINEINDMIITSSYNSGLNNTEKNREHKYISPKNTIESKKLYSSLYSHLNLNDNIKLYNSNFNSTYTRNTRNTVNKNHININIENILNTDNKINIISNNEKNKFDINVLGMHSLPNKKLNFLSDKKTNISNNIKNFNIDESLGDIQIPSIPEENIQVIPLKTMKYNNQHITTTTKDLILKFHKIFQTEKMLNCILLFLSKEDFYYLSYIDNFTYKILIKLILNKLYNQIVKSINNNNIVKKIWNYELLKYSDFIGINNFDSIYQNYISNSNNIYDKEISKDLLRTLPNDSTFQRGSSRYQKLFNILKAYSNYNNEIGYAQGMNFIVAKLIKFFDNEKEAFIYLDSLFNKLNMVEVLGIKNNLEKKMKMIHFLLKTLCPDILFFLEKKKINHEIFTAKWYITLFSKNFKYDNILMVIWNFAIIFGWKFIFLFSISVIISFKDKYINLDLYDFTQYMKNIFIFEHFQKKFNDVMKLTFNYMSQWKNITKKIDLKLYDKNNRIKNNKIKSKIKRIKSMSEKDEDETFDDNDNDNYKEKEDIIFNDDYAFS